MKSNSILAETKANLLMEDLINFFNIDNNEKLPLMKFVGEKLNLILYLYDKDDFEFIVPSIIYNEENFETIKLATFTRDNFFSTKSFKILEGNEIKIERNVSDNINLFYEFVDKELNNNCDPILLNSVNVLELNDY